MSKLAVIYWSGTGNTKAMAEAVAEGAKGAGAEVDTAKRSAKPPPHAAASYDKLALGCSAMGDEVLEEAEFEPFFQQLEICRSHRKEHLPVRLLRLGRRSVDARLGAARR